MKVSTYTLFSRKIKNKKDGGINEEKHLGIDCAHNQDCSHDHHSHHHDHHWLKAAIGLVWGIGLLILSLASFNIPIIAYYVITGLSALLTLFLGHKVYQSAGHSLLQRKWDMSTLYTISTITIIGISIAGFFVPGLPMMLESAPLILGFWHLGEAIEHTLLGKINKKLDVLDCAPETVLLKEGPVREVSVKQLIPDNIIVVNKGEVIPVDGILREPALLYTTKVDGSPHPKRFNRGDAVKAGMSFATPMPKLEMQVTQTYQDSYLSLISKNINKANNEKSPVEQFANKILKYFIPCLLAVAIVSGIVIGLSFPPALAIPLAIECVTSVLVSACPCALSLITPMAVRISMKKASDKGVHYKNGKALQAASGIDTVVFDLNGTLTQGEVSIEKITIEEENEKFLECIALLENKSDHPVAKTIKGYIERQGVVVDESLEVTSVDKSHHSGIKGTISGQEFMIGNKDMLRAHGVETDNQSDNDVKNDTIYMVRGSEVIGQISLTDRLRQDAVATVSQLQSMGKEVHICTGADQATAERYAALLNVPNSNICANTVGAAVKNDEVPKESYIQQLQRQGRKVAMVGDAANDLTAIARADIGISVKSSIGVIFTEQNAGNAGMVVHQGLLFPIAIAFDIASKTKQNIFQNLFMSLIYNSVITLVAAGVLIALVGFALNPAIGVALMVLESTIVLANLYRLKQQKTISAEDTISKVATGGPFGLFNRGNKKDITSTNRIVEDQSLVLHKPDLSQVSC